MTVSEDTRRAVAAHPGWYHTIDLAPDLATPGFCDLRPLAPRVFDPVDLTGIRALDVGTFDGFWAFSMESRGAHVVAIDLEEGTEAEWPPNTRAEQEAVSAASGLQWGSGFALAHDALGSSVQRVLTNVYDLETERIGGAVDVVLCGTILQHLRDPVGALERMHDVLVPGGRLLMVETFSRWLTLRHPRRPVADFRPAMPGNRFTWWVPNEAALRGWATTAGFTLGDRAPVRHRPLRGAGKGDHVVVFDLHKTRT